MYFTTCLFNSISYQSSVDDIQLPESIVVDERRRANHRAILNITVEIDVSGRIAVPRIAEQFHRVGDDSFVGVCVARTSSRGNRLAKVSEALFRFVLYNSVHVIHNKSMHKVPLQ